jgi:hypothetical protein
LAAESVVLIRALVSNWYRQYGFFFAYLACVFFQDLIFGVIYLDAQRYYAPIYWSAEFLSIALGCGVTWEVFRRALKHCPGAGRMARSVFAFALVAAVSKIAVNVWTGISLWPGTMIELERNMRAIQAVFFVGLALLVVYYGIPIGRNLTGILFGYGVFISTSVLNLTLRAFFGSSFQAIWANLQPPCYLAVLVIWSISLWNYQEAPIPSAEPRVETDYEQLVMFTKKGFLRVRAFLGKDLLP